MQKIKYMLDICNKENKEQVVNPVDCFKKALDRQKNNNLLLVFAETIQSDAGIQWIVLKGYTRS